MSAEAERLRAARTLFERAARDGVSMAVARARIAEERHRVASAALARRAGTLACGTSAPPVPSDTDSVADAAAESGQWWQQW